MSAKEILQEGAEAIIDRLCCSTCGKTIGFCLKANRANWLWATIIGFFRNPTDFLVTKVKKDQPTIS